MSAPSSGHFLVDMWARGVFSDLLDATEQGKGGGVSGNEQPAAAEETFALNSLLSISTVGPALWSAELQGYYEPSQPVDVAEDPTVAQPAAPVLNKRRVNQVTSKGRMSASVLYQELCKPAVDEHRLVAPYDYGEQFGAAENLSQPYRICVHPQVGLLCDVHGHLCDAEVIGLLAGKWDPAKKELYIQAPFPCSATERHFDLGHTDVELDSEAEWKVREAIAELNLEVVGWYHSHPKFRPDPSVVDIINQQQYQCFTSNDEQGNPFVGLIVSTYDPQLPTAVANHQWFTVVPYSPGSSPDEATGMSNINSTVDLPGKAELEGEEAAATAASKTAGTPQPVLYMPVRMEVEYYNVVLDKTPESLTGAGMPQDALITGFVSQDSDYAQGLLEALQALRLESPGGTPGPGNHSSSLVSEGVAALARSSENETEEVDMGSGKTSGKGSSKSTGSPRAKRPKGAHAKETAPSSTQEVSAAPLATSEDGYWSSSPSATPTPLVAATGDPEPSQSQAPPHLAAVSSVSSISKIPQGLDALTIEEGTGSWASNSLAGSASVSESGDDRQGRRGRAAAKGTKKNANVTLLLPGTVTPAEDGALQAGAAGGGGAASASANSNDSSRASTTADSGELTIVTPKEEGVVNPAAVDADHELAVKLAEQQDGTERRRPSRTPKGRQHFGDFVDPLTALDGHMLRKQNVAKVVAQEKKEKLLAKRAKESNGEGEGGGKKKRGRAAVKKDTEGGVPLPVGVAAAASDMSGVPPKGKKRTKGCKTCKPVDLLATVSGDGVLCAPSSSKAITKKRSQASIKSETSSASATDATRVETVHTSVLLALQDLTLRSSQLARQMLCTVVPQYRGLVLTLISMGMYYGRSPRRSDLHKAWRSMTRLAKVKASATVWCARLGLQPGGVTTLQSADGPSEGRMLTKAALAEAIDQTERYLLIEWLGIFLTACWEDYVGRSRKRKNAA